MFVFKKIAESDLARLDLSKHHLRSYMYYRHRLRIYESCWHRYFVRGLYRRSNLSKEELCAFFQFLFTEQLEESKRKRENRLNDLLRHDLTWYPKYRREEQPRCQDVVNLSAGQAVGIFLIVFFLVYLGWAIFEIIRMSVR